MRDTDSFYLRAGRLYKGKRQAYRTRSLVRSVGMVYTQKYCSAVGCSINITCSQCMNDRLLMKFFATV
jgi:hypothetical protein